MSWKKQFETLLGSPNASSQDIDNSFRLKERHLPRFLYRYRPASEWAIQNLANETVWFGKASALNDEHEFAEQLDFERLTQLLVSKNIKELTDYLTQGQEVPAEILSKAEASSDPIQEISAYLLREQEGWSEDRIIKAQKVLRDIYFDHMNKIIDSKIKDTQEKMKVCSFSESPDIHLMWSHYAGSYKGFCVEYDMSRLERGDLRRRLLFPVLYTDEVFDSTEHLIQSMTNNGSFNPLYALVIGLRKSEAWKYEKEWRMVMNLGDSFPEQNYSMNCQSAVYLGVNIEADKRKTILKISESQELKVMEARPIRSKYGVEFIPLNE